MSKKKKIHLFLAFVILFYFGFEFSALAHKVTVFAWVEDGTVYTESKLGGGKRVREGDILVYDENENLLLRGKTDDQGEFSFPLPKKPPLIVELNAGMGHLARWTITPEDTDDMGTKANENDAVEKADVLRSNANGAASPPSLRATDTQALAAMVEQSVDRAIDKK